MTRPIGIVGVSAEGAALCYRTICAEGTERLGRWAHPEVTLHTHPLSRYMTFIDNDEWEGVAELMASSAGAEILVCPDNTAHAAFARAVEIAPSRNPGLEWLHIAEVVADAAVRAGFRRLALLGTRYLMEGPVYSEKLEPARIDYRIPGPGDRERINTAIFERLVYGRFEQDDRRYVAGVIARLAQEGCDAAVLGCTEIPLLISPADSPLPVLDSTRLLARAALDLAVAGASDPG